ncbi:MAG: 2-C-methyl-D-erythritol 4-phosphate cytidylyltransferase [Desulfobacterales bacterium]|nr:2-C-methyl-D-erythritol 4-phosphate cytidylyltransferase [Desulfobacterales bacterium]
MNVSALIVAAGKGMRMQSSVPKQYILINNNPIISITLKVFDSCDIIDSICLVAPKDDFSYLNELIIPPLKLKKKIQLIEGGDERQESVYNGIMHLNNKDGIIVIHDGVRPFITCDFIKSCVKRAEEFGACILGLPSSDTLKKINDSNLLIGETISREHIWMAQTPQAFKYEIIKFAHCLAKENGFKCTDDASLIEWIGKPVKILKGSKLNIKITDQDDLMLAKLIMANFIV